MKNLGVWLDKEKAHIVTLENEKELFTTIKSEVENFHPSGGFGLGYRGSPQDVLSENKYMEREKNQVKSYFSKIISKIKDADAIAIFGPAEIPEKLRKELQANFKDVSAKVKGVQKVDSMTDNQIKSLVRDFFN
jgi:hypothetical protein